MHKLTLIGIAASRAGSGKTTVAQALVNNCGFVRLPLAEPIKRVGAAILREAGVSELDARRFLYHEKETVIPRFNITGRHLLQTLGTDWGRRLIHPGIWETLWRRSFDELRYTAVQCDRELRVVVDDLRFPNEAAQIQSLGGQLWMIERPRTRQDAWRDLGRRFGPAQLLRSPKRLLPWNLLSPLHPSEGALNRFPGFDARLRNDGTIHDLIEQIWSHVEPLGICPSGLGPFDAVPTHEAPAQGTPPVVCPFPLRHQPDEPA